MIVAKCPDRDSKIYTTERASSVDSKSQCTHLSFVQAQHYRDALESRAIRKLNHKSEMVRIRLRGLEAFMRWVVNWQIWAGFLLSLVAGFSYPFLLSHWEITRDYAWANLILFAIA